MYKLLLFLKKTDEKQALEHFKDFTLKYLSELAKREIKAGKIESSLLLDKKYTHFCELETGSKEEMDALLSTRAGKELNNDLMNFHEFVDIIFVAYNE